MILEDRAVGSGDAAGSLGTLPSLPSGGFSVGLVGGRREAPSDLHPWHQMMQGPLQSGLYPSLRPSGCPSMLELKKCLWDMRPAPCRDLPPASPTWGQNGSLSEPTVLAGRAPWQAEPHGNRTDLSRLGPAELVHLSGEECQWPGLYLPCLPLQGLPFLFCRKSPSLVSWVSEA